MRCAALLFVSLLTACLRSPHPRATPPAPLRLVGVEVSPESIARDRLSRLPTVALRFDRALGALDPESAWLVAGEPSAGLQHDAERGVLSTTNAARVIPSLVRVDPRDATRLLATPRAPLDPDARLIFVASSHVVALDHGTLQSTDGSPAALLEPLQLAPERQCPSLARLRFPTSTGVPADVQLVAVDFDRPMFSHGAAPGIELRDPAGRALSARARWSCVSPSGGSRCAMLEPIEPLAPDTTYALALTDVFDDHEVPPQPVDLALSTIDVATAESVDFSLPIPCASDETALEPFCYRFERGGIVLRGETTGEGALQVSTLADSFLSAAGRAHRVWIDGLAPDTDAALTLRALSLSGVPQRSLALGPVRTPPLPSPLEITEVLSHPNSGTAQEFVEVLNVGASDANTDGMTLATATGSSTLPAVVVGAGARAVIVGARFDPRGVPSAGDPGLPAGTIVVRTSGSLAGRGLSDRGADLWLANASGQRVSFVPLSQPSLAPKQGVSSVRADARLLQDDPAAWSYDANGGSTPGLADRLR